MSVKKVLFAVFLLAIAVGSLLIGSRYLSRKRSEEEQEKMAFALQPQDIAEIKISNPNGALTIEKNEKGQWYMTEPVHVEADLVEMADMPGNLAFLRDTDIVEDNPRDLSKYHLDKPDITVRFRAKGSSKWITIHFGQRAPTGSYYYAFNPDKKRVFIVDFEFKFRFNGPYFKYINRKLFPNHPRLSDKAVFEFADKTFEFALDPQIQYIFMTKPNRGKAHSAKFSGLFATLSNFTAIKIVTDKDVPKDAGFANPFLKITFSKTGEWAESVVIGNTAGGLNRYAKKGDSPVVYVVDMNFIKDLRFILDNILSRFAIFFPNEMVSRIDIDREGKSFSFYREAKDKPWQYLGHEGVKVNAAALINISYKIGYAANRGYTGDSMPSAGPKYELDKPRLKLKLTFLIKKRPPLTIYFGKKDVTGKFIYSYNSEDPNILKIDASYENVIPKSGEALIR